MLWYVNEDYRARHKNDGITVEFVSVTEAEMDEMGSFVGDTSHQCWLWWAIDHTTGEPLAFHFGTGEPGYPFIVTPSICGFPLFKNYPLLIRGRFVALLIPPCLPCVFKPFSGICMIWVNP